jgi:hypothetical protein
MLELEWVHTTYKHQNDLLCTCMYSNTANLSKPTACINCSITSTLPRTWQDINRLLGPHRHLQLVTVYKKVYFWVKTITPPPFEANRRLFIEWRWRQYYIARCILTYGTYKKGRVSLRAQGTKQQVIFHCAYACPKINNDMLWNRVTGSLASLSMIRIASKNSLPTWLSPSLALRQCCQLAIVHDMIRSSTMSLITFILC